MTAADAGINQKKAGSQAVFATTHWSVVQAARENDPTTAAEALAKLCSTYWYPLYAFLRRQGRSPHDAEDLTQGFFAHLLAHQSITQFQGRSKFRSFLLGALKNYVAGEWSHAHRLKRGGGAAILSFDEEHGESRYQLEPVDDMTPEKLFDRRWAVTVLELTFDKLRDECRAAGKEQLFGELKGALTADTTTAPYAVLALKLGMSEGSVKVAVHRLRSRYRELLRDEIRQTVTGEDDLKEEIRDLLALLRQ